MSMLTRNQPVVRAEDVVASEYAHLGWARRLVLRWVSPEMHRAARHLAANPHTGVVNVPVVREGHPFLGVRPLSQMVGSGNRN